MRRRHLRLQWGEGRRPGTVRPEPLVSCVVYEKEQGFSVTNREIIEQFEGDQLTGEFHHEQHVRLAFAYLSECPVLEALDRFVTALQRFAAARGKGGLYHETITYAYFFLIRERMARTPGIEWEEFSKENVEFMEWKPGILVRYYCDATLQSDLARKVFLFPDRVGS